jgi:hypothetical protein
MPLESKTAIPSRYHWRATHASERPYIHAYHTSLVDKIYLCSKPDPRAGTSVQVHQTFEGALERIRKIDQITRGIPKIMYLVGWQFEGHDSGYPDWSQVNSYLKRAQDRTPADSLRWLMKIARQYHTTVSLHINMNDAYERSPLWNAYRRARLFTGKGGVWGGEQAYLIDHAKEWEQGLAQERIDNLCRMLPLVESGTVHIDAFWPTSPDLETALGALRRIVRYWRNKGVDVSVEGIVTRDLDKGLIGLSPMAWHINHPDWKRPDEFTEEDYMQIPSSLFCGGVDHSQRSLIYGTSMQGEALGDDQMAQYLAEFCQKTLPWQYLNRFERQSMVKQGGKVQVEHADGLTVDADLVSGQRNILHDQFLVQEGGDLFVPALWQKVPEIIAYSQEGYASRWWTLPPDWEMVEQVKISRITPDGLGDTQVEVPEGGSIELALEAGEAVIVQKG